MTKAEKTKQFIIEKSAPIFNVKGIAGTAMSDIMEATNMAKGTLYVHFENKDELACSVVDFNLNTLLNRALDAASRQTFSKDRILAFISHVFNPQKAPLTGGCPMINFGMEADDTNQAIRKKVNRTAELIQEHIKGFVQSGIANKEFKKSWDATRFAIKTFALIEGGIVMTRISGDREKMSVIKSIIENEIEENSI